MIFIMSISLYSAKKKKTSIKVEGNIYNDGKKNFATSKAKFSILARDKISSVKSIMLKIDKGKFTEYKSPVSIPDEGSHILFFYSIDNVENKSSENTYGVTIDNTPPEANLIPSVKLIAQNKQNYAPGNAEFTLTADDKGCGLNSIEFAVDKGEYSTYSEPVKFKESGLHTIKYRAKDNLGNTSKEKSFSINIDNEKPAVKIKPSGKLYTVEKENYAPAAYTYSVKVEGKNTGISQILVSVDSGKFQIYKTPITLTKEGKHTIRAKAIDIVGNESEEAVLIVTMDATPPDVELIPGK